MNSEQPPPESFPPPPGALDIKQKRSQLTYDSFIQTGLRLSKTQKLGDISVQELAREAGYSVGAFYARFRSKDEFLEALLTKHLQKRSQIADQIIFNEPPQSMVETLVRSIFNFYYEHRFFWKTILKKRLDEASYWRKYKKHGEAFNLKLTARIGLETGRELTPAEESNIAFASQMLHGWLNNMVMNVNLDDDYADLAENLHQLIRAYRLVSGLDTLLEKQ